MCECRGFVGVNCMCVGVCWEGERGSFCVLICGYASVCVQSALDPEYGSHEATVPSMAN